MLITLSGVDCSGKSTQIELLRQTLAARGCSVGTFWYRPGYSKELDRLRALARRLYAPALPTSEQGEERQKAFSSPRVKHSWIAVALIDTALQYGLKLRALMRAYDVVVCDRYIEDAALDFSMRFPEVGVEESMWFDLLRDVIPTPDLCMMLMVSKPEMLRRMKRKKEPFPDPPDIRQRRYAAYQQLAHSGRFHVVDASTASDHVHEQILKALDTTTASSPSALSPSI
jgi:thymidylate kinase